LSLGGGALARLREAYTTPTARQLNEPKINRFDQFGRNIIGMNTARNNSALVARRNVPSNMTGDNSVVALP